MIKRNTGRRPPMLMLTVAFGRSATSTPTSCPSSRRSAGRPASRCHRTCAPSQFLGSSPAGANLADIADLLGHKDLATTQIYAKVQQDHLRAVIGKLAPVVAGASRSPKQLPAKSD